jgi:hypothetical protein
MYEEEGLEPPHAAVMYHGSSLELSILEARPSGLLDGDSVIYGTNRLDIAVFMAARVSDLHIEFGTVNKKLYALEKHEGAFDKLKKPGYIYVVSADSFVSDSRLGLQHHEFVSHKKSISPQKTFLVLNIKEFLEHDEESKINMITWGAMIESIEPLFVKK